MDEGEGRGDWETLGLIYRRGRGGRRDESRTSSLTLLCAVGILVTLLLLGTQVIRTIRIEGFKSIVRESIELGRVNCFIGANGSGKSNILEAIGILGAAASGRVDDESILRRGMRAGLPRLYKCSFASGRIPPHIGLRATGEMGASFDVSLLNPLEKPEPAWSFKTEALSDGSSPPLVSRSVRGVANLSKTEGLSALKLVELPQDSSAVHLLRALQGFAIYCPNTPSLRGIVPDPQTRDPLGLAGGRLAEAFAALQKSLGNDERFESVMELIDWVKDIRTVDNAGTLLSPTVPRGGTVLRFTDRHMRSKRNTLTAYDASEGALYILFAAILCLSKNAPKFMAVDNLDQALNPRLMANLTGRLSGWLKSADAERQLLFTAHNPAVLDGLNLQDDEIRLFTVERNSEGHTKVQRVEVSEKLLALNSEYPLSRLWLMGNLGAVPNV